MIEVHYDGVLFGSIDGEKITGDGLGELLKSFPLEIKGGFKEGDTFIETSHPPASEEETITALRDILPDGYSIEASLKAKSDDDLNALSHEDFIDHITPKPFMKASRDYLLQALLKVQKYTEFVNLAPQEAEDVYSQIIDVMTQETGWSLQQITKKLQIRFPQLNEFEAERIARTETTAIANKARELDFKQSQPEETLYYWGGPDDDRTSNICQEIKSLMQGKGLPLEQLRTLVNEVSLKYGMRPRDWTPHPNCRHTVRIWYGDI